MLEANCSLCVFDKAHRLLMIDTWVSFLCHFFVRRHRYIMRRIYDKFFSGGEIHGENNNG